MNVAVIGGGFAGLSAAWELARAGYKVTIFERSASLGGLAGSFEIAPGVFLEKFYHHWFSSDSHILDWIKELGGSEHVTFTETKTTFRSNKIDFRLSTPLDLLRFKPLSVLSRIRTGWLVAYSRMIKEWHPLDRFTAEQWVSRHAGKESFEVLWRPLLEGKFGRFADQISAVWMWSRLAQRGSSRNSKGAEELAYFRGGFKALIDIIQQRLCAEGVTIHTSCGVDEIRIENGRVVSLSTGVGTVVPDHTLCTTPLPLFLSMAKGLAPELLQKWRRVEFMANVCLILKLSKPLSDAYWTNISDSDFPFVVAVEHTNFDNKEAYDDSHIVYLSRYLLADDPMFSMTAQELLAFTLPKLKTLYPSFSEESILDCFLWKEPYSQPIPVKGYKDMIPPRKLPLQNLWLASMAQIYPEGRTTNVVVKHGRAIGKAIASEMIEAGVRSRDDTLSKCA